LERRSIRIELSAELGVQGDCFGELTDWIQREARKREITDYIETGEALFDRYRRANETYTDEDYSTQGIEKHVATQTEFARATSTLKQQGLDEDYST
jgi:hypothetical protein